MKIDLVIGALVAAVVHAVVFLVMPWSHSAPGLLAQPPSNPTVELVLVSGGPSQAGETEAKAAPEMPGSQPPAVEAPSIMHVAEPPQEIRVDGQPELLPADSGTISTVPALGGSSRGSSNATAPAEQAQQTGTGGPATAGSEQVAIISSQRFMPSGSILETSPSYYEGVKIHYPEAAVRLGYQGTSTLLLDILPDGSLGRIEVYESSGHAMLDRAAVAGIRRARFKPAMRGEVPVATRARLSIEFKLLDR